MKNVISVSNMRLSDEYEIKNHTPSLKLMYEAAQSVYEAYKWHGKIAIVCGSGNNAGDGYALSIILKEHHIESDLILLDLKFSKDGLYYFNKAKELGIKYKIVNNELELNYDIIVDALLGTGFKGNVREEYKNIINKINASNAFVISIDINSGLNGDNGLAQIAIKSDLTVSIGEYKYGHFLNSAQDYIKNIINANIGIKAIKKDALLLENDDVKKFFKPRLHESNKGTYGYVGIMGGSLNYPGAVKLASLGKHALYAGCGVSRLIVPDCIAPILYQNTLETTIYPIPTDDGNMAYDEEKIGEAVKGLKALSCGIGWQVCNNNQMILAYLLKNLDIPLVIDADGLNNLSNMDLNILNESNCKIILTPHIKEFSRLCKKSIEEIKENEIEIIKEFVNKYNVTLLLKGPTTVVASKDEMYFVDRGTPGMATAGSGDVLTGIITGMLGYNFSNITLTVAVAAYINGLAGEYAEKEYGDISMVASDTARCVSNVIHDLTK